MKDIVDNIPNQLTLPFDMEASAPKAEVISFFERREIALASSALKAKPAELSENEIIRKVLERAERLTWYK